MRVIDKTPLQDAKGNISFISRIQGTLKYGLNWYAEYQSQKVVLNLMDRFVDKGFIAIRNFKLPDSDIIIPIIVIGPGSLTIILSTPINGQFEANGTAWNIIGNNASTPAKRNLINILSLLTRAFQRYLKIHNINVPVQVEPVLIATDPGANIETNRPAVRVVRSDAIKQFISTLNQARPLLRVDQVNAIADLILEPNPTTNQTPPEPKIPVTPPVSRAQAIFNAAETPAPGQAQRPRPAARPAKKKQPALKPAQIALLVVMGIIACCIVIAAVYFGYSFLTV
ncbi:MAG: hypothetical protein H6635_15720 [Anaerolineales bacterium]|nr:hypothetical protein [Anaerolineales bacterium]MCB9146809.1 hypothetical protein [Anaerolineales bacterium]